MHVLTTMMAVAALAGQQTDTIVPVRPGSRLDFHVLGGDVTVRTWDRNELRIVADLSARERLEIASAGAVVSVRVRSHRGASRSGDFTLTVPASMDLDIGGTYLDVSVDGARGEVKIETVQGDVTLQGGRRFVSLHSVQGDVEARDLEGRIQLGSVNGEVHLADAMGSVTAETVNGDIALQRVRSASVKAATVNGEIRYEGSIEDDGRYAFSTHNGDVVVSVPAGANATVSVSTFNGDFESAFPVTLTETRAGGKRFSFVLGSGSARLELDSFGGTIQLVRPGGAVRRR